VVQVLDLPLQGGENKLDKFTVGEKGVKDGTNLKGKLWKSAGDFRNNSTGRSRP